MTDLVEVPEVPKGLWLTLSSHHAIFEPRALRVPNEESPRLGENFSCVESEDPAFQSGSSRGVCCGLRHPSSSREGRERTFGPGEGTAEPGVLALRL